MSSTVISAANETASLHALPRTLKDNILQFLDKKDIINLSRVSRAFYHHVREYIYESLYIKSGDQLSDLTDHLGSHIWDNKATAIHHLAAKWDVADIQDGVCEPDSVDAECDQIIGAHGRFLCNYACHSESLTFHFPGAFEAIQQAVLLYSIPSNHFYGLKRLSIGNGSQPLLSTEQNCTFVFYAISYIGQGTLEELSVDGGHYEKLTNPTSTFEFVMPEFHNMMAFPQLDALRKLEVKNLPGFHDDLLFFLMSGLSMTRGAESPSSRLSLSLENLPDISNLALKTILEYMGNGLENLRLSVYKAPEPMDLVPSWWDFWLNRKAEHYARINHFDSRHIQRLREAEEREARENVHLCDVVRVSCPNLKLLHLNVENYPSVIGSSELLDLRVSMADSGYESGTGQADATTLTDIQRIKAAADAAKPDPILARVRAISAAAHKARGCYRAPKQPEVKPTHPANFFDRTPPPTKSRFKVFERVAKGVKNIFKRK
jgi:hypothetical protein